MVSKCANPSCSAVFRYWHQGKLYRVENGPKPGDTASDHSGGSRRLEFFWLCDSCAAQMTVEFSFENGIRLKPLARALQAVC
jgi:hypothetical protein